VRAIAASGRRVAVIGVENGYSIGLDIRRVKEFHDRGARYLSVAHNGHSQLADSNTGELDNQWLYGGLSPLGGQVIAEMNKWGLMIDAKWPAARRATVKDFVDHIDYLVKLIGIDHVAISSDFDGGGIDGWNSAAETFHVTLDWCAAATPRIRLRRSGAATCCGCGRRSNRSRRASRPERSSDRRG